MRTEPDHRDGVKGRHSGGSAGGEDALLDRVLDGRYRIVERVARGGTATVYVAHDQRLDRVVAIKVMHSDLDEDGNFAERFVREARSAAKLSHPNVVAVYDQGEDDGVAFLAMEFIDGHTLRDTIASQAPLGAGKALSYLEPILSALAAAHRIGIVHRDIKPENVLLTTGPASISQRVKVVDFGLARAVSSNTAHTDARTGTLVGTVSYMAPELVTEGRSDPRTDVYAAGIVLYELLTGRKPHTGSTPVDIAYKHVNEDIPAPSRSAPGIPRYVDALVARATARDAALRPADAGVLLHLLHRVQTTLSSGIADDPDLLADLALPRPGESDSAATLQVPPTVEVRERRPPAATPEATAVLPAPGTPGGPTLSSTPRRTADGALSGPPGPPPGRRPGQTGQTRPVQRPGRGYGAAAAAPHDAPLAATGPLALGTDHEEPVRIAPTPAQPRGRWRLPFPLPAGIASRRGPLVVGVSILVVALIALGVWWLVDGRYDRVPSVAFQSQAQATATLQKAGFEVEATTGFSDTVPKGEVIGSDPGRGDKAKPHSTVRIVVSKGIEQYPVPKVAGEIADDAQDAVMAAHLEVGDPRNVYSDKVAKGHVIRTDPRAGTMLRPGRPVVLVISKGPEPVTVVDWTGREVDRAQKALRDSGFTVKVEQVDAPGKPGRVLSQSPSSGTLPKGSTITLTVSKGPATVTVPNVMGQSRKDATKTLKEAGFKVDVQQSWFDFGMDQVTEEDHVGEQVPYGSTITIKVS